MLCLCLPNPTPLLWWKEPPGDSFQSSAWTPTSRGRGGMGFMQVRPLEGVISDGRRRADTQMKPNQTLHFSAFLSSHLSNTLSKGCVCVILVLPEVVDWWKLFPFQSCDRAEKLVICRREEEGRSGEEGKNEERQIQMVLEAPFLKVVFCYPKKYMEVSHEGSLS